VPGCLRPKGDCGVVSMSAPDPRTVQITLDRAAPMFLDHAGQADMRRYGDCAPGLRGADGSWIAPIGTGRSSWGVAGTTSSCTHPLPALASLAGPRDGIRGKHVLVEQLRFLIIRKFSPAPRWFAQPRHHRQSGSLELMGIRGGGPAVPVGSDSRLLFLVAADPRSVGWQECESPNRNCAHDRLGGSHQGHHPGERFGDNSPIRWQPVPHSVQAQLRPVDLQKARQLLQASG